MTDNSFFDEQTEQSLIKTRIVTKYFPTWAKIMIQTINRNPHHKPQIAYIDLFAGPGRYKDGSSSTPVQILEKAISDSDIRTMLTSTFNDASAENVSSLQQAIDSMPGIESLKYPPQILNYEVGDEVVKAFQEQKLVPTLFFIDPWGYKGLSRQLINSVIKDWGCDCIFFFNYNRINMGLSNADVENHMNAIFGEERAEKVRKQLKELGKQKRDPQKREAIIVEAIYEALKEEGGEYVLSFRFKQEAGNRTSHHLIFVSKHVKGYDTMKDIMAKESSEHIQGVPSYEHNPAKIQQLSLLEWSCPLDELEAMLVSTFAGRTLSMEEIYKQHNVGTPYIKGNYKAALGNLEAQGKLTVETPTGKKRRKGTFADDLRVTFPAKQ